MDAEVMPLPSPEMTPPDTNMNFGPRVSAKSVPQNMDTAPNVEQITILLRHYAFNTKLTA